jgi:PAS domain S-box-containing protein
MQRFTFRQRQFFILLLLVVVPVVIIAAVAMPNIQRATIHNVKAQLEVVSDLKSIQVQHWFDQGRDLAYLVSVIDEIQEEVPLLLGQSDDDVLEYAYTQLSNELSAIATISSRAQAISLLHPTEGWVFFSTDPALEGRERGNEDYFQMGREGLFVSPISYSVGREKPVLTISVPAYDANNQLLAVVAVEMNLNDLANTLNSRVGLGDTGQSYLVDAYGFYVTLPSDIEENPLRTIAKSTGVERALAGENGNDTYVSAQGIRVLGVYRWLPVGQLGLLVEIHEREITDRIVRVWLTIGALSVGILALGIFAARYLTNWLVGPLERIVGGAEALQSGDLSHRVPVGGPDEIGRLGLSFNNMAESLQHSHENLEQEVEERTAAFKRAYEQLHQEIAERERMEIAVIRERDLLRELMDNIPDTIYFKDVEGRFTRINQAQADLLGVSPDEAIGKSDFDFFPIEIATEFHTDEQKIFETGLPLIGKEERLKHANGTMIWVSVTKVPLKNPEGDVIGLVGVSRNITEIKEAEEQRVALALEKERVHILANFITQASHEFRTPLSTINTSTHLLSRLTDPERRQHHARQIEIQVRYIAQLVEDLTALAQLDSGGQAVVFADVELNGLIRMVKRKMQNSLATKQHELLLDLGEQPIVLRADAGHLVQTMRRILNNAIRYTPDEGIITIRCEQNDGEAIIEICDTGIGINEQDLPHIFERFYRNDTAGTTRGFGLGLPIAKSLIELHQGRIEAESEEGQGSVFKIILPMPD